jgi:hypothetical protein
MRTLTRLMIAGAFVFGASQIGFAQTQAAPPAAPAAPAEKAAPSDAAAMKARAKECSKKATEKGLHGKARKEFREKCKRGEE